ncbi:hypothetical protein ABZ840_08165 [Streptomyces sp. NPDC047117]|uniref:hypothetical protein n=1 Tax=Streptomyces sp. NPDC047117 TaxID=3155379 RepID=UPI0033D12A46
MTLHIDPVAGLVFLLGCAAAYGAYRHSKRSRTATSGTGDLVGAITAGAAVVAVAGFLFGASTTEEDQGQQQPVTTQHSQPPR